MVCKRDSIVGELLKRPERWQLRRAKMTANFTTAIVNRQSWATARADDDDKE
jgi:hypothetical protein